MAVKDIRLINNQDIKINPTIGEMGDLYVNASGDFEIADSDKQHIEDILRADKGWWKEFPLVGVAMWKYLNSSGKEQEILSVAKLNLQSDGYKVGSLPIEITPNGQFNININDVERI